MQHIQKNDFYRPEIDGLRAFAVLIVIFFHLDIPFFNGGYVGVDIFFVISGYLISSIILNDLKKNKFTLKNFYLRRIRRIIPILSFVILVSSFVSFFILLPYQLVDYSFSAISSIFFFSNFYFWQYSGYFSPNSNTLPLLHSWSLSIEEQYYIIYPVILIIFLKYLNFQKFILILFICLSLLSVLFGQFGGNLKFTYPYYEKNFLFFNQSFFASFYLPFGRIWELLIGYFLYLNTGNFLKKSQTVKNFYSILGLLLLLFSIYSFNKNSPHPGFITFIPVIGTALIILFCDKTTLLFKILSYKRIVFIGLISYSLYLWHYPLYVYANLYYENFKIHDYFFYMSALFLISYYSWRFIELPFRNINIISNKKLFISIGFIYLLILIISITSINSRGFINMYENDDKNLLSNSNKIYSNYVEDKFNIYKKNSYDETKINILIIGDSQAQDFVNILSYMPTIEKYNFKSVYISSKCQIYYPKDNKLNDNILLSNRSLCSNENNMLDIKDLIQKYENIFIISSWKDWSVNILDKTIQNMDLSSQQKLFIVGPKDFGEIKIKKFLNKTKNEKRMFKFNLEKDILKINDNLSKNTENYEFINLIENICERNLCPKFTEKGDLISYDGGHLTPEGAKFIYEKIKDKLEFNYD